jgi:hypothetical protein
MFTYTQGFEYHHTTEDPPIYMIDFSPALLPQNSYCHRAVWYYFPKFCPDSNSGFLFMVLPPEIFSFIFSHYCQRKKHSEVIFDSSFSFTLKLQPQAI